MTVTLTREEAQQVLDALADAAGCVQENYQPGHMGHGWGKEIETLRARLSAPEPEPVAWMNESDIGKTDWKVWAHGKPTATMPLYPAQPQSEWQGLTDEEIEAGFMANTCCDDLVVYEHVARAIEAKLREKNT